MNTNYIAYKRGVSYTAGYTATVLIPTELTEFKIVATYRITAAELHKKGKGSLLAS